MGRFASAILATLATAPASAQSYDCTLTQICIATDCADAAMAVPLTIDGDGALMGPPDEAMVLRAVPLDATARRAFVAEDGHDVFFATLGETLEFVMTSHLVNPAYRYAVTTGQCQEAR
ncbi:MAG: hypothetical protein ACK4GT_07270 [Pararhodobacter sp.]